MTDNKTLIEHLAADFRPVPSLHAWRILAALIVTVVISSLLCVFLLGPRTDLIGMITTPVLLLRNLLLVWLGAITAWTVVEMAFPQKEISRKRWQLPLCLCAIGPFMALMTVLSRPSSEIIARVFPYHAMQCVVVTVTAATLISGLFAFWLRRGAATHPNEAAWIAGVSSGAFGALIYSWHCPHEDPLYIGIWYTVAVFTSAALTRFWMKPVIHW